MNSEALPWTRCPACRRSLGGTVGPEPGDIAICTYCTEVLTVEDDGSLRRARLSDLDGLEESSAAPLREAIRHRRRPG